MENAADALKIVFAIFAFIVALSMVFSLISTIKETADEVLFITDKTNFYGWENGNLEERKRCRGRHSNIFIN